MLHALYFLSSWWRDLWFLMGPFLAPLSIVFYYYFKRKTQQIWFCSWKLKLSMQLAILIKDAFYKFLWWYPFGLWFTMDPYVHFIHFLPPVWCAKNMSSLDLISFSPIDGVISLVIRLKKTVLLSKRFQMLWDHTFYEKKVLYKENSWPNFILLTGKHSISL